MSKIDLVAQDADGTVLLVLRHEPPSTVPELQQRVQDAVGYALDGQLRQEYPDAADQPIRIRIDVPSEPSGDLAYYLNAIGPKLQEYGLGFVVSIVS